MTVLEEVTMSSTLGGDRYITPEYLAPLPQVHITDHSFEQKKTIVWSSSSLIT